MTTAERLRTLWTRCPVDDTGLRNFEVLSYLTDQTERIAKRTTSGPAGITFTFRDDSSLTYNAETQQATTTRPQATALDVIAARQYIMAAINNRRHATA